MKLLATFLVLLSILMIGAYRIGQITEAAQLAREPVR